MDMSTPNQTPGEARLETGEAWAICNDCGARLHSFDGNRDRAIRCPYNEVDGRGRNDCKMPGEY